LETSSIPYSTIQPLNSNLWDGNMHPVSILEIIFLGTKHKKNISLIGSIRFMAWNLISSIYKSGWNKLMANKNNFTFCQCIAAQVKSRENKKKKQKQAMLKRRLKSQEFLFPFCLDLAKRF